MSEGKDDVIQEEEYGVYQSTSNGRYCVRAVDGSDAAPQGLGKIRLIQGGLTLDGAYALKGRYVSGGKT